MLKATKIYLKIENVLVFVVDVLLAIIIRRQTNILITILQLNVLGVCEMFEFNFQHTAES